MTVVVVLTFLSVDCSVVWSWLCNCYHHFLPLGRPLNKLIIYKIFNIVVILLFS